MPEILQRFLKVPVLIKPNTPEQEIACANDLPSSLVSLAGATALTRDNEEIPEGSNAFTKEP